MHGLALRGMQTFVEDCFGSSRWKSVVREAALDDDEFEAMLAYPDETGAQVIAAMEVVLERPAGEILEDFGTYLVSNPKLESLRRLLRFGGVTFEEFLHSLDDLPGRLRVAVPDLDLPTIRLRAHSAMHFSLTCASDTEGFGHVLTGMLRTMADDYGALAMVDHRGGGQGREVVAITLLERTFAEGRSFDLAQVLS